MISIEKVTHNDTIGHGKIHEHYTHKNQMTQETAKNKDAS